MTQLLAIFLNVLTPVFALVLMGYIAGPRLGLQARTLSRYAYTMLTPAFTFNVLSNSTVQAGLAVRMIIYIVLVHLGCSLIAFTTARLLQRSREMTAVYIMVTTFGNVGNFGLPIITFALGDDGLAAATIYFLAVMVVAFSIGVAVASWSQGGNRLEALMAVIKTPALLAVPPAILCNWLQIELPMVLARPIGLLAGALIPTMLVVLGVQLAQAGIPRLSLDMVLTSIIRLVVSPLLAVLLAVPFGITGLERSVGILQASMPMAVLTSIIAAENDLLPAFVTTAILFSTVASVITLTVVVWLVAGF
jgi:hypothetical protein